MTARRAAAALDRLSAGLNRIALWGAVAAVVVMTASAAIQVVARYVFHAPPVWTEELARYAMVWAGMLGASAAFRAGADPSLFPQFRDRVDGTGRVLALLRAAGVAAFVAPVLYFSIFGPNLDPMRGFLARSMDRTAPMLQLPMIWFAAAIPVAFVLIAIHMLAEAAVRFSGVPRSDEEVEETEPT